MRITFTPEAAGDGDALAQVATHGLSNMVVRVNDGPEVTVTYATAAGIVATDDDGFPVAYKFDSDLTVEVQ